MSEEKEDVDSVADVEAEVIDDEGNEFKQYIDNLPKEIAEKEGSPSTPEAKVASPASNNSNSPAIDLAKAAVATAVANTDGNGKKLPAKPTATHMGQTVKATPLKPKNDRKTIDPEKDGKWLAILDKLKEFKRLNGHCNGKHLVCFLWNSLIILFTMPFLTISPRIISSLP